MTGRLWSKIGHLHQSIKLVESALKTASVAQEFPDCVHSYEEHIEGDISLLRLISNPEMAAEFALAEIEGTTWALMYTPPSTPDQVVFSATPVLGGPGRPVAVSLLTAIGFTVVLEEPDDVHSG